MEATAGQNPALQISLAVLSQISHVSPVKGDPYKLGILSGEIVRLQLLDYWDLKVTAVCHSQGNFLWNCNMVVASFYDLDVTKY